MKIEHCSESVADRWLAALARVEPLSKLSVSAISKKKRLVLQSEHGDLMLATEQQADFDNAKPYVLLRFSFADSRCSAEFVEVSLPAFQDFLRSFDPGTIVECYTNFWEELAVQPLLGFGFKSASRTLFMQNTKPFLSEARTGNLKLKQFDKSDARKYYRIDVEASKKIQSRSKWWLESHRGERGIFSAPDDEDEVSAFSAALERFGKENFIGLYEGSSPIGYMLLKEDRIDTIALHEEFQGKGLGSQLLSLGTDIICKRGADKIACLTSEVNIESIRFFEGHGFKITHFTRWYWSKLSDLKHSR
jgi:ribosomal protein S18 acetylase RimI-like enzyme